MLNKDPQASRSRKSLIFGIIQGKFLQSPPVGFFQDGGVKSFFVPEMIVDGGKVSPGPAADFPDGGVTEAAGGKDFAGGQQEALAGFGSGGER